MAPKLTFTYSSGTYGYHPVLLLGEYLQAGLPDSVAGILDTLEPEGADQAYAYDYYGIISDALQAGLNVLTLDSASLANLDTLANSVTVAGANARALLRYAYGRSDTIDQIEIATEKRRGGDPLYAGQPKAWFYPNPTTGTLTFSSDVYRENATLRVYDMTGRLITTRSVSKDKRVDLQNLNPGIYFLESGDHRGKVVLQK